MGSFPSTPTKFEKNIHQESDFSSTSSHLHDFSLKQNSTRKGWEKQFHMPQGELECVSSGFTTFAEFMIICETVKRICDNIPYTKRNNPPPPPHHPPPPPPPHDGDDQYYSTTKEEGKSFMLSIQPSKELMYPFFEIIIQYMPFLSSILKKAPLSMVIEIILCHISRKGDDELNICDSYEILDHIYTQFDSVFQRIFNDILPQIRSCIRAFSPELIAIKNNYFCCSEPILAPYFSYSFGKDCKNEFFISLEKRTEMLCLNKNGSVTGDFLMLMSSVSKIMSEILLVFVLRTLLSLAQFIYGEKKEKEWKYREGNNNKNIVEEQTTPSTDDIKYEIEKYENYTTKLCKNFELLAEEELLKCRRYYPHVFAFGGFLASWGENEDRPPTMTVISNLLLKLMYLFAGGLRNIAADDMDNNNNNNNDNNTHGEESFISLKTGHLQDISGELPSHRNNHNHKTNFIIKGNYVTDDIALASSMSIYVCGWVTIIIKLFGILSNKENKEDAILCSTVLRILFQYMGVLPFGLYCPKNILQWMNIFPLYILEENEIRIILQLYSRISEQETHILRPIDRVDFFRSFTHIMKNIEGNIMKRSKSDIIADIFFPEFNDEVEMSFPKGSIKREDCEILYDLFAESCMSTTQPTIDITKFVNIQLRNNILGSLPSSLFNLLGDELSNTRMAAYTEKTGALLQWSSIHDVKELHRGDILCIETRFLLDDITDACAVSMQSVVSNSVLSSLPSPRPSILQNRSSVFIHPFYESKITRGPIEKAGFQMMEYHLVISWAYQTSEKEHIVIFEGNLTVLPEHEIQNVKLIVNFIPPFISHGVNTMWTNSHFPYEPKNPRWSPFPFTFGWLLGNSFANNVILRVPIAPLLFRLLRYVLKYGVPLQRWKIHPCTLSLVDIKLRKQAEDLDDERLEVLFNYAFKSNKGGNGDLNQIQALAAGHATHVLLMNIDNNVEKTLMFWEEVAEGFRLTPLGHSSLLCNCCSRIVRNVLCGTSSGNEFYEHGFRWEDYFIFLCAPSLDKLPYGWSLLKSFITCLNTNFIGEKARDLLLFFTGKIWLPPTPLTECIFITFVSNNNKEKRGGSLNENSLHSHNNNNNNGYSLRMLPLLWPGQYVLEISAPLEPLLFENDNSEILDINLLDWKQLPLIQRTKLLTTFKENMKNILLNAIEHVDMNRDNGHISILRSVNCHVTVECSSDSSSM